MSITFELIPPLNYNIGMQKQIANYHIIIRPDTQTGSKKVMYTAYCPTLGIADDGVTIKDAVKNVTGAIQAYINDLSKHGEIIPEDHPESDIVTTTQVKISFRSDKYAQTTSNQTA